MQFICLISEESKSALSLLVERLRFIISREYLSSCMVSEQLSGSIVEYLVNCQLIVNWIISHVNFILNWLCIVQLGLRVKKANQIYNFWNLIGPSPVKLDLQYSFFAVSSFMFFFIFTIFEIVLVLVMWNQIHTIPCFQFPVLCFAVYLQFLKPHWLWACKARSSLFLVSIFIFCSFLYFCESCRHITSWKMFPQNKLFFCFAMSFP